MTGNWNYVYKVLCTQHVHTIIHTSMYMYVLYMYVYVCVSMHKRLHSYHMHIN